MLGLIIIGLFLVFNMLKCHTKHNQKIEVPDLKEVDLAEAKKILTKKKLRYYIEDSIYKEDIEPGIVVDQNPKPAFNVKEKRTVYLVTSKNVPPSIEMLDLIDNSLRIAEQRIIGSGLKLGRVTYKPDIAKNSVLEQHYKGEKIAPGTLIKKGETIDLVLGDGLGGPAMNAPDLIGLRYQEALTVLSSNMLSTGRVVFDDKVTDQNSAIVYEQFPSLSDGSVLERGAGIDIYLTNLPDS